MTAPALDEHAPARILSRGQARRLAAALDERSHPDDHAVVDPDDLRAALEAALPGIAHDADVLQEGWDAGYTAGHRAALDARPDATVYVPTATRWRHTAEGDTFLGGRGTLWHIRSRRDTRAGIAVTAACGARTFDVTVDPDEPVTVLVATAERDAVALVAEHLGGKIIGRGPDRAPG